jgi:hypothetical protein
MINKNNYAELVYLIDYTALPEAIQKGYDFVKKCTSNYTVWDVYNSSEKIKQVIDIYFKKVESYVPKLRNKETQQKATTKKVTVTKPKATETRTPKPSENINFSERLVEEIKLIKRFVNLQGKQKTQEDILRFINSLQKAIVEKKVRKTSVYAKEIEFIQDDLITTYNQMGTKTVYHINQSKLEELAFIVGAEKVFPSMLYIKKFLGLVGKSGIKQKATALKAQLHKAVSNGKITKQDKYADKLDEIFKTLSAFLDNPTQKTIEITEQELSGLNGIVEGCNCEINGLDAPMPKVMNSLDFANMQFNTIGLKGKWFNLIGDPSPNFSTMVYGKPKMGKSYLCIDFAGYLARNHGKVLYVAKEEGLDFTLQKKLNDKDVKHENLFVASELLSDLNPYQFIFLDSVNKLGLSADDLTALKKRYPHKSFVFIFQTTKDGNFRGANSFQHDVDVVVEVPEKGKAVGFGRFSQGGEIGVW